MPDVLTTAGKPINWSTPPKAEDKVKWSQPTTGGKTVAGSFRTICHLNRLDALSRAKFGIGVQVIQSCFNSGVAASAGTHDYDACLDVYIPNQGWYDMQKFFRANGFACWYRHAPLFGNHIHGFTLPVGRKFSTRVGVYVDGGASTGRVTASSQVTDYYNHAFALAGQHGKNSDTSWFPANIDATIFDLAAYIKSRAVWVPKPGPISVPYTNSQFVLTHLGKPVKRSDGVGLIQQALNKHGAALTVDGLAGPKTTAAWRTYEHAAFGNVKRDFTTVDVGTLHKLGLTTTDDK